MNTSITSLADEKIHKAVSFEERRNLSAVSLGSSAATEDDFRKIMSQSAVNLNELKNIQFRRLKAQKPLKSEFRTIGNQDKAFLQYLGINI